MASFYWISTLVRDIGNHHARRTALTDEITALSSVEWNETTSFHLISSALSIDTIAARLKGKIDPRHDQIVIRRLNTKTARYVGSFDDVRTLKQLMPYATKV
jgi:hypothetical protein